MSKKDREIHDLKGIESIINQAEVCRLALSYEDQPYIVPLNFGYKDRCLYFHTGKTGKKIDILKKNPQVCFQLDTDLKLLPSENPCKWNMTYQSVIGYGKAAFVDDPAEKRRALDIIVNHYGTGKGEYKEEIMGRLAVIRMDIARVSGKISER